MTAAIAGAVLGLALACAAALAITRDRPAEALGALGLALAAIAPMPWGSIALIVGLALAFAVHRARAAIESERAAVAAFLADVRPGTPSRASPPVVRDEMAARVLQTLRAREAAIALATPRIPSVPPVPSVPPGVRARFMAAMGHELRSPLNSITGFAQLLEDGSDGPLNEAQRENIVLVRRAAGDLLTLLTDILDAARIEAGRVRLDRQWTAPVEVLTLALERFRASIDADAPSPNVDMRVQPGLDALHVDRARLGQALFNVLRAVAKGPKQLAARVREAREGDRLVIRFELFSPDEPITEADAARAFDPDPAARPKGRSLTLGLALSVARDLAQLHRGDARAESLDGGTNWVVWVPIDPQPTPPIRKSPRPRPR